MNKSKDVVTNNTYRIFAIIRRSQLEYAPKSLIY